LASDTLSAALLDVFEHEPLAADDPLWQTPGLTITPHIASSATHECIAEQVIANVSRLNNNLALHNQVNTRAGY
ncbi:MAG: NAD(P)-dependent oxidoreductase, partial [Pseudomonas marincola]